MTAANRRRFTIVLLILIAMTVVCSSCAKKDGNAKADDGADEKVTTLGSIEVTAKLVEIRGDLIDDPIYDYAHVMKYQVIETHRGIVETDTIYIGHYNPAKARADVADVRVGDIGGNLKKFKVGATHRMALEVPIDDHYMGGIINKYFDEYKGPVYWAVWTNSVAK